MIRAAGIAILLLLLAACAPRERSVTELAQMSTPDLRAHYGDVAGEWERAVWSWDKPAKLREQMTDIQIEGCRRAGYPPDVTRAITERQVWDGMSADELWWSKGPPKRRYTNHASDGTWEHWYWGEQTETWPGMQATLLDGRLYWFNSYDAERQ